MKGMGKVALKVLAVIFIVALVYFILHPIVLDFSYDTRSNGPSYNEGDTVTISSLYDGFVLDDGKWTAYLILSRSDLNDLASEMPNGTVFKSTDKKLLRQLVTQPKFIYTGGDLATVQSQLLIFNEREVEPVTGKHNVLVYSTGIVLDNSGQGLQDRWSGWVGAVDQNALSKYCKEFNRIYWPIVILRED
jgi:hypothetical protein